MTEPAELAIAELSREIRRRALSPTDLIESCLGRIAREEPSIRAFVTIDEDGAYEQARLLTHELAANGPRGPLHGIPVAVKDLVDVRDLRTTAGSAVLADNTARSDARVVGALRASGAAVVGKSNTHEFGYGVVSPPTRNPWDENRIPGGSSGGSAAAVAAGMCPGALGTDTAGSIRIPSALCGVSGLLPRPGIVSMAGIVPLAPSLDRCGPIARTAEDLALVWGALTGRSVARSRIRRAALPVSLEFVPELDDEVHAAFRLAVEALEDAGIKATEVSEPTFEEWDHVRIAPLMAEALAVHRDSNWYPARVAEYTDETLRSLRRAEGFDPAFVTDLRRKATALASSLMDAIENFDVLVVPSTPIAAPTHEDASATDDRDRTPVARTLTRLCAPFNWCPVAVVAVPCGLTASGLPMGIQFVARDEDVALSAAMLYQEATDWHARRPPSVEELSP